MRNRSIQGFLSALADRVPAPGGGASAALHGAQAAAVVAMVARYSDGPNVAAAAEAARAAATTARVQHGVALSGRHATVTICHSRTRDLPAVTRQADVLVAAVGRPGLITAEHVSPGTVVIDVGTNPTPDGGLAGDVDPTVRAAGLTPVPGGVGPVTTALLLQHTVHSAGGP